jgi:murein DD-endopeptidase MepM/ murein hydrolase activator NlpD
VTRAVFAGSAVAAAVAAAFLVGPGVPVPPALADRLPARKSPAGPERAACPTHGWVSSGWGPRAGKFHDGVDIEAPMGQPIRAVRGGTVIFSATADPDGYGQYVRIREADGSMSEYGHMSVRKVRTGQRVVAGQVIALVGAEGSSTGPHLHYRWRLAGVEPPGRGSDPVAHLRAIGIRLPC